MQIRRRFYAGAFAGAALLASALGPCIAQTTNQDVLSDNDSQFLRAITAGVAEVAAAHAHAASSDASVSLYAKTIARDHALSNSQLEALAKRYNVPYNADPPGSASLPSAPAEYMRAEVAGHQAAIALFQKEATSGTDAGVKSEAATVLPVLQQHLKMAQQYVSSGTVTPEPEPTTNP